MTTRPSLLRSIPFWLLIVLSLATVVYGAWLFIVTTGSMTTGLAAQTATTADVYVGQIIAIIGGILIGTGLLGLALALVLAALRSLIPAPAAEIVEPIDWNDEEEVVAVVEEPVAQPVVSEPALAEPVVAEPVTGYTAAPAAAAADKPAGEDNITR